MAKRPRKGEFLLCRDYRGGSAYKMFLPSVKPRLTPVYAIDKRRYWQTHSGWGPIRRWTAAEWHRLMPDNLRLKPGGGPIRIRVEAVK